MGGTRTVPRSRQRWVEAAADYEQAIRLKPDLVPWLCDAAECWLMAGREQEYSVCRGCI